MSALQGYWLQLKQRDTLLSITTAEKKVIAVSLTTPDSSNQSDLKIKCLRAPVTS